MNLSAANRFITTRSCTTCYSMQLEITTAAAFWYPLIALGTEAIDIHGMRKELVFSNQITGQ